MTAPISTRPMTDWRGFAEQILADLDAAANEIEQLSFLAKLKDGSEASVVDSADLDDLLSDLITDLRHRLWLAQIEDDRRTTA